MSQNGNQINNSHPNLFGWLLSGLVAIQIGGLFLPVQFSWGFNYWQLFPLPISLVILILALIMVQPLGFRQLSHAVERLVSNLSKAIGRQNRTFVFLIVSLILLALFYFFRSRAYIYGDGFLVLEVVETPFEYWPLSEYFMKPLSMLSLRAIVYYLQPVLQISPVIIVGVINALAGVAGFWAILHLARSLTEDPVERLLLLFGSLAGGGVIMFFGYMEYYPWAISLMLWSLSLSVGYLKGNHRLWPAWLIAIIATGFHFFTSPAIIAAALAAWINPHHKNKSPRPVPWGKINLSLIALSILAAAGFQLLKIQGPILSPWPITDHNYWVLNPNHLLDIFNELILVAPIGLVGLTLFISRKVKATAVKPTTNLLFTISLFIFLLTFWINPELGAVRDWDLLSFFSIPFSLWGILYWLRSSETKASSSLVPLLVISLIYIVPNLYEKNHPDIAVNRLDNILWLDPHYQTDYRQAYNAYHLATALISDMDLKEPSLRYLRRAAAAENSSARTDATLAYTYYHLDQTDSAFVYFNRALSKDPGNEEYVNVMAQYELDHQNYDKALAITRQGVEVNPGSDRINDLMALVYANLKEYDSALIYGRRATELTPDNWQFEMQLGRIHGLMLQFDSAYQHVTQALKLAGPDKFKKRDYLAFFACSIATGRLEQAHRAIQIIERLQPKAVEENRSLRETYQRALNSQDQNQ